jgi:transposase-like protein
MLGLNVEGRKEAVGLWIGREGESAKFWLKIFSDIRNRGVETICVVCCDGLTALPEAIEAVFGDAWIQTCVVHLIRSSLKRVSWKDKKAVAKDLKPVYTAATEEAAASALVAFDGIWAERYPMIGDLWRAR